MIPNEQSTSMFEVSALCESCSAIDFDHLRAPTAGQLRRLSAGENVIGPYPFRIGINEPEWPLGTVERIRISASSCSLCRGLVELIDDIINRGRPDHVTPDLLCSIRVEVWNGSFTPHVDAHLSPKVLEYMGERRWFWLRHLGVRFRHPEGSRAEMSGSYDLKECAYAAIMPFDPSSTRKSQDLFDDESLSDQKLVFCGRKSSSKVDLDLLRAWIQECTSKHDQCVVAHSKAGQR